MFKSFKSFGRLRAANSFKSQKRRNGFPDSNTLNKSNDSNERSDGKVLPWMIKFKFEDLEVWDLPLELVDEVYKLSQFGRLERFEQLERLERAKRSNKELNL